MIEVGTERLRPPRVVTIARLNPNSQVSTVRVDETTDARTTWHTAWRLSPGRNDFIAQAHSDDGHPTAMFVPFGLVVTPAAAGHRVVTAMGPDGLLIRQPDGIWTRTSRTHIRAPSGGPASGFVDDMAGPFPQRQLGANIGTEASTVLTVALLVWCITLWAI